MHHYTIPIFIPERACPNRCIFCNQSWISGAMHQPGEQDVIAAIEKRLGTIASGNEVEIGFFGGNFTGIEHGQQKFYLSLAQRYVDLGHAIGIRISTRPDYINNEVLQLLKKYTVTCIELGAQSLDDEVLNLSGRGHTVKDIRYASSLILENEFQLGLQMMIGLPGDTIEKSLTTARGIVTLGASNTRIYPTLVIRDTDLENRYRKGEYLPLSLEEAIAQTKEVVKIMEAGSVKILRIGLHPSEGLLNGETLVAGPFHVAFGERVAGVLWQEAFRVLLAEQGSNKMNPRNKLPGNDAEDLSDCLSKKGKLIVEVPPGQINAAVGYKAENRKMLLREFNKVIFRENPDLKGRNCVFGKDSTQEIKVAQKYS